MCLVYVSSQVKTSRPLDREKNDIHYFTVVARDGGDPPLSTTTTLTIHIDDVNDNTPYFVYPSEVGVCLSLCLDVDSSSFRCLLCPSSTRLSLTCSEPSCVF